MPNCTNCTQKNYYGDPNCEKPLEPQLAEEFRTWNIGNPSVHGDWTKYHPWRSRKQPNHPALLFCFSFIPFDT